MELILVAKDSMPIYFQSNNKKLDDINVAAFISAVKSFAKGSLQSDLVSLKLGDLDIRLKESDGLMYVLGMSINTELMPSEEDISELVQNLGSLTMEWLEKNKNKVIDDSSVPKDGYTNLVNDFEKKVLKDSEGEHKNGSSKIISSSIKDWNLLPMKTQEVLSSILEPIIVGDKITILDNNHNSPIIKDLCKTFRLTKEKVPMLEKYSFDIEIGSPTNGNLVFDPENNKITGKFEKNKYLSKFIDKILNQQSIEHQNRLISLLINTIGSVCQTIITYEVDYATQQGKILNLLNNLEFEEVRLVLEIIKRNRPSLHEKLVKLPIHKEWFNKW